MIHRTRGGYSLDPGLRVAPRHWEDLTPAAHAARERMTAVKVEGKEEETESQKWERPGAGCCVNSCDLVILWDFIVIERDFIVI